MTHEQKPESAEFRTQDVNAWQPISTAPKDGSYLDLWVLGLEEEFRFENAHYGVEQHECGEYGRYCDSCPAPGKRWIDAFGMEIAGTVTHWRAIPPSPKAEAEQRRKDAEGIEEAKDEGANYVLASLALLFGRDGFEIRDGSETWEGDVNATLEGILKSGGLVDDEGDLLDLATLKDRLAEQRRKDAEGAEPVAWVSPEDVDPSNTWCNGKGYGFRILEHHSIQTPTATTPLYTHPTNVTALEARVRELEGALAAKDREIAQAVAADRERNAMICDEVGKGFMENRRADDCERAFMEGGAHALMMLSRALRTDLDAAKFKAAAIREGGER